MQATYNWEQIAIKIAKTEAPTEMLRERENNGNQCSKLWATGNEHGPENSAGKSVLIKGTGEMENIEGKHQERGE